MHTRLHVLAAPSRDLKTGKQEMVLRMGDATLVSVLMSFSLWAEVGSSAKFILPLLPHPAMNWYHHRTTNEEGSFGWWTCLFTGHHVHSGQN